MKTVGVDDEDTFGRNGTEPAALLLEEYRVDLVQLIERGIPDRDYVPGCDGWLRQGKRYLDPAAAGTGKSLAWLVIGVGIIEHGGSVVILDVENGSDEYAHRLQCILDAHGDDQLAERCRERLRYYEWPRLSLEWEPAELVATMAGADVVIFDSSRLALSQVGLDEDRSATTRTSSTPSCCRSRKPASPRSCSTTSDTQTATEHAARKPKRI